MNERRQIEERVRQKEMEIQELSPNVATQRYIYRLYKML